ncbi:hypothetical protein VMCG_04810 [Cytospora schulzeri]|uniref:Uncharacterized protein n=1 Tax=Cytospora schulzeri TaxID=448051 RepID=A0A423WNE7_9PEZI|nr:hypothetical protein VMCG_04810 [Valsa malicola]
MGQTYMIFVLGCIPLRWVIQLIVVTGAAGTRKRIIPMLPVIGGGGRVTEEHRGRPREQGALG